MFAIKVAGFTVGIDNKYDFVKRQCEKYIVSASNCDFSVFCSDKELSFEKNDAGIEYPKGYTESICIYKRICREIIKYDAFLLHSALVDVLGDGYAFAAKSGVGKSTHASMWKKCFGDSVKIVNGDKPILRFENGLLKAYGTPWCGKENQEENMCTVLKNLCFIERSAENHIEKISKSDAACRLMGQIFIPYDDAEGTAKTLELADRMLNIVDTWLLGCNISEDAARLAYNVMSKERQ